MIPPDSAPRHPAPRHPAPRHPAPRSRAQNRLVVHVSNPEIGGAEASLFSELDDLEKSGPGSHPSGPMFLVPAEGPLSQAVVAHGWETRVLPWPCGYASLTQTRWRVLLLLPGLIPYLFRLASALRGADGVWSSGVKSHTACLALSPWLRERLLFDIRDFLRAPLLRGGLAFAAARYGCRIAANSRAVGAAYPGAEIRYPRIALARPRVDRRPRDGRRIVTHLAYFAPYKGQDLFLRCARALLDAGVDAEFRLVGDVIYPAPVYAHYRDAVQALARELGLGEKVRFLGKLPPDQVQEILEGTHLLLHCTTEPEPFGRAPLEALLCGCEVICHQGSGVCEIGEIGGDFPAWAGALRKVLGPEYVQVRTREGGPGAARPDGRAGEAAEPV